MTKPQETADLVTFAEEILNGKPDFFVQCISLQGYFNLSVLGDFTVFKNSNTNYKKDFIIERRIKDFIKHLGWSFLPM